MKKYEALVNDCHLYLFVFILLLISGCSIFSPDQKKSNSEKSDLQAFTFHFDDKGEAVYYTFNIGINNNNSSVDTLIFFISGSGCASVRDRFPDYLSPLKLPASVYILQKRGIVDGDSGTFCSKKFLSTDYFEQTLADQQEFISKILSINPLSYKNIVIIGASEGAMVAAKIAQTKHVVTHLGLIGSGGADLRTDLTLLSQKNFFFFGLDSNLHAIAKNPDSITDMAWGHTYKYWSSILDVDLRKILPELDIPIVIAMGEQDESVPIESLKNLKHLFQSLNKDNLIIKIYPDSNHRLFDDKKSISHAPDFLKTLEQTINRTHAHKVPY